MKCIKTLKNEVDILFTLENKENFLSFFLSGEFYLGYNKASLAGVSWYHLIHPDNLRVAQIKHRLSESLHLYEYLFITLC